MRILIVTALLLMSTPAWAHKPSDSYLSLTVHQVRVEGRWDIALRDLDDAIGLDGDGNGEITWGEVRSRQDQIAAYALSRLTLASGGRRCATNATRLLIDHHTDGAYTVVLFTATCPDPIEELDADYRLLFDLDAQHRGLLRLTHGSHASFTTSAIFSQETSAQRFTIGEGSLWRQVGQYLHEGIWHIWLGFDHLLFLLTLLLPAVLVRVDHRWQAIEDLSSASWEVLRIVTAFTFAHSLTLSLATLGIMQLPSRLVESAIASSVILAGVANLYPGIAQRRWVVAFAFGLIHGFGFASVLSDLGLPHGSLLVSLVSFNVGVEIGQLAVVVLFLPLAHAFRRSSAYQLIVVRIGSLAVIVVALLWLAERAFDLKLFPV